jgi:KUP system potassium uptake protein
VVFGGVELTFFAANLTKIIHGGWLPLLIAITIFTIMTTWQRGRDLVTERRLELEGPLEDFIQHVNDHNVSRVPGTAVFPHISKETTPLALRANVAYNHVLHERIVIVTIKSETVPHVPPADQLTMDNLGDPNDGIVHLTARYGFQDDQNIPEILRSAQGMGAELDIDPDDATYFLSRITLQRGPDRVMPLWRKKLFIGLAHNAASPADYFQLPDNRTVVMGFHVDL